MRAEVADQAVICPSCGCAVQSTDQSNNVANKKNNGFAVAGFVLSLVSFVLNPYGIVGALGLIFSIVGLIQIHKNNQGGKGMAIAGIVCSCIGTVLAIILFAVSASILAWIFGSAEAAACLL